jgi:hypothetical protein
MLNFTSAIIIKRTRVISEGNLTKIYNAHLFFPVILAMSIKQIAGIARMADRIDRVSILF